MICNTVDTMNAYISNRYPCTYNKKQKNPKYFNASNWNIYLFFYQIFKYREGKNQLNRHFSVTS